MSEPPEGYVTVKEYHAHRPWCRARKDSTGLSPELCNCGLQDVHEPVDKLPMTVDQRVAEAVRAAEQRLLARVAKLPRPIYYKEPNPYEGIYICVWCDASWPWKDEHESPLRGHPANDCLWADAQAVPARPEERPSDERPKPSNPDLALAEEEIVDLGQQLDAAKRDAGDHQPEYAAIQAHLEAAGFAVDGPLDVCVLALINAKTAAERDRDHWRDRACERQQERKD